MVLEEIVLRLRTFYALGVVVWLLCLMSPQIDNRARTLKLRKFHEIMKRSISDFGAFSQSSCLSELNMKAVKNSPL